MKTYLAISYANNTKTQIDTVSKLVKKFQFHGTEINIASIIPRNETLFSSQREKNQLIDTLNNYKTKRIHMSYWA